MFSAATSGVLNWTLRNQVDTTLLKAVDDVRAELMPEYKAAIMQDLEREYGPVAMVGDVAKSSVPMLGYTVPYAVANTLLTLWGLVIVLMVA